MTTNYDDILKKLDSELNVLEIEEEDILVRAEKGIKLAKQTLKKVRSIIVDYEFKTKSEEIHFFKCTKPKIYSKLIYYVKLFNIEGKRPRGSNKSQVKYLNNYIEKLQTYFNDNLDFYHYYRREATVFDEQYFLRGKADIRLFPDSFHFFVDEQFATSHDSTVATILAYDLLIVHLKREIDKLENNGNYASLRLLQSKTKITWTAHKIYLIELIYALHSTDVINNGTVDIKDIAYFVEKTFKVDLGDYYRAFLEIRMRKNGRTKFLDILKKQLTKRMDDTDNIK
ncbi:RteC domain-containing protein [Mesonia sp. MT50]|uniref:Tetracycline regulation of excision, RteC n=2 Tax=Flavobacteriaceae TaxID=49546 RepID=A0A3E1QBB9_9FLAO|nr:MULTISPECIES: RteC domain-containing protein [Flavobacteriaceae]AOE07018.1 tetracycline resistance element mobilization regulatory protein RteC [uncultured bacterium]MDQ7917227.1 RteC domain-containing protein [Mesonia profundi]RFN59432.1 tetracycline regulation of excision, RteC [Marixanthomonas ophiurae]